MLTVADLITQYRQEIGDTTCSVPENQILAFLNKSMRQMVLTSSLRKLFEKRRVMQLDTVNDNGTPAVSWDLPDDLVKIEDLRFMDLTQGGVRNLNILFQDYSTFFICNPYPEMNTCGLPCRFTIDECGGCRKLMFDRPSSDIIALDICYSYKPLNFKTNDQVVELNQLYSDVLVDGAILFGKMEAQDYSQARALWEDLDTLYNLASERLNDSDPGLGYRYMRRSF